MATFTVSTSAQLTMALSQASGGDKILLAAGNYGQLEITGNYDSPLTIASANPGNPASFSTMSINGAENVTVDSVVFNYDFKESDIPTYKPFEVVNSSKVVIQNSVFEGDMASGQGTIFDGHGTGIGLSVRSSSGVEVEKNEFKSWGTALQVNESQNVQVQGNNIHDIRKDGMNFVEVQGVVIENNYIHDFKGLPDAIDHRDMIQFWTTGTNNPSTDIIIRKNVLDIGNGSHTQSIFMRNEVVDKGQAGQGMFYQNVLIENNVIINHHLHGITVGETAGLVIQNNTLVAAKPDASESTTQWLLEKYGSGAGILVPRINVTDDSQGVGIKTNTFYGADFFTGDRVDSGSGASVTGNVSYPTNSGPKPGTVYDGAGGGTDGGGTGGGGTGGGGTGGGGTGGGLPVLDDYVANFVSFVGTTALKGNAIVKNGVAQLDGKGDYVNLGRLPTLDNTDELSFSIDFSRDVANGGEARLVWNHQKLGLVLKGDGLFVKVAGEDGKFKLFSSGDLGLNDTNKHSISVIVDSATDRLQVIVDGDIAIDRSDVDLDLGGTTGREWWLGGAKWRTGLDGQISDFQLEADAHFQDNAHFQDDALF
jgi:Right handed beta helix region